MPKFYNILIEVNDSAFLPVGKDGSTIELEGFFGGDYETESIALEDYQLSLVEALIWTLDVEPTAPSLLLNKIKNLVKEGAENVPN